MHLQRNVLLVSLFAFAGLASISVNGQQHRYTPPILLDSLPSTLMSHAQSIGDRVLKSGKERTTLTGELITERGERYLLRVTLQLPDNVRIEGLRPTGAVSFDGSSSVSAASDLEQQLLEMFGSDTAEAMLSSSRDGAAVQLLGRYVRSDSSERSNTSLYDIYEWSGPVRSSARKIERLKRFAFDSNTGLLAYTEYLDETFSPPLNVRILFTDWRVIQGSAYPGRIDRMENGYLKLSWQPMEFIASRSEQGK